MHPVRQFLLAVSFLTRIPIKRLDFSKTDFARATVYFPVVGALIGGVGAGFFALCHLWFSTVISVALSLGFLMLLTGGLHEDGVADAFDAFGSKTEKSDILETMRDSRIGTYAALALIMTILLKFLALNEMSASSIMLSLVLAHTISRWAVLPTLALLPYPRKSAAVTKRFVESVALMPKWHLLVSIAFTVVLSVWLVGLAGLVLVAAASLLSLLFTLYFWKKIQGATGDCYGTIQQFSEILVYLLILKLL